MQEANDGKKLAIGTVALILAIVFFGGFLKDVAGGIFDFGKLTGQFPEWFKTAGGTSAKGGFYICAQSDSRDHASSWLCRDI